MLKDIAVRALRPNLAALSHTVDVERNEVTMIAIETIRLTLATMAAISTTLIRIENSAPAFSAKLGSSPRHGEVAGLPEATEGVLAAFLRVKKACSASLPICSIRRPGRKSWRLIFIGSWRARVGSANDDDRQLGMGEHFLRLAAEKQRRHASPAVRSHFCISDAAAAVGTS